jgi:hypothetical protein
MKYRPHRRYFFPDGKANAEILRAMKKIDPTGRNLSRAKIEHEVECSPSQVFEMIHKYPQYFERQCFYDKNGFCYRERYSAKWSAYEAALAAGTFPGMPTFP